MTGGAGRQASTGLAALVALITVVALGGCSPQGGPNTRPPAAGAIAGGAIRVGITEPGSIDPQDAYEPQGELIDSVLCEPLLELDTTTGRLRPGLVTSWLVTDGGQRITIRLGRGLHFSDGSAVTADDVSYSLSRAASAEYAGHEARLLQPIDGYDEIHGDREAARAQDRRHLRGVSVIDNRSLSINLRRADAEFVRVLASSIAAPVSRRAAERDPDAFAKRPVCAGPYALDHPWTQADRVMKLHRTASYRPAGTVLSRGGSGYADTIEFTVFASDAEAVGAWTSGQVDVVAVPRSALASARRHGADLVEATGPYVDYIGLPSTPGSPFADPSLRRALSRSLDRTAVTEAALGGARFPATGFLPPAAGEPAPSTACATALPPTADPVPARAVVDSRPDLRQATIPLFFNDELDNRPLVEEVARQWHDGLGLTFVPTAVSFDDLLAKLSRTVDGAFRFGWQPPYPGPDPYLTPLFATAEIGRDNVARYASSAVDRLLVRTARTAGDEAEQLVAYRQAEDLLCRDLPLIPIAFSASRWLVRQAKVGVASGPGLDRSTARPVLREMFAR